MNLTLTGIIVFLIIAGICGAIGRAIGGGTRGGLLVSVVMGFIGALLGSAVSRGLRLPELMLVKVEGHPFPILWSIIGAALFVAIIHLLSGGYRRHYV